MQKSHKKTQHYFVGFSVSDFTRALTLPACFFGIKWTGSHHAEWVVCRGTQLSWADFITCGKRNVTRVHTCCGTFSAHSGSRHPVITSLRGMVLGIFMAYIYMYFFGKSRENYTFARIFLLGIFPIDVFSMEKSIELDCMISQKSKPQSVFSESVSIKLTKSCELLNIFYFSERFYFFEFIDE